jgi:hypothetical protein
MQKFEAMIPLLLRRLRVPVLAASGLAASAFGQTLVSNSPFAAVGGGAGSASARAEAYELAGSTSLGSQVSVCIFERQNKRSEWITVGETVDGVRVVSYDATNDSAVVTIDGTRKDLTMRKDTVASSGSTYNPSVVPVSNVQVASLVPVQPSVAAAPGTPAAEQREARMLVSDLLEIGLQQRKAYENAKQRAAAAAAPQPSN